MKFSPWRVVMLLGAVVLGFLPVFVFLDSILESWSGP